MACERGIPWSRLPEDVLLIIMAKLPAIFVFRMRVVCKNWNKMLSPTNAIKMIYRNVPIVHYPAFFLQLPWTRGASLGTTYPIDDMQSWIVEPATGEVYKVPMPNFVNMDLAKSKWGNLVIDACKSIYCCFREEGKRNLTLSLLNPGTNTWRRLPYHKIGGYNFTGMAFYPSTSHCILLIGQSIYNTHIKKIDMYDSESNAWSVIDIDRPISTVSPYGTGVYSKGKFHWMAMHGKGEILQFNIQDRKWTKLPHPRWVYFRDGSTKLEQAPYAWALTGTDGRVVLVNKKIGCMWELKEDSNKWCQLHIMLGRGLRGVSANSSGWTLVAVENKLVVYDSKGRVVKTIEYSNLDPEAPPIPKSWDKMNSMWAIELNNVWWP